MTAIFKVAQFFGFAVAAIILMLVALSVVVNQLPTETTVKTSVTQIHPK